MPGQPAPFYTNTATYRVPIAARAATYHAFVVVDDDQRTDDSNRANNVLGSASRVEIRESPTPDIVPIWLHVPGLERYSGEVFALTYAVEQSGEGPTPNAAFWSDRASTELGKSVQLVWVHEELRAVIPGLPNANYTRTVLLRMPDGIEGNHTVFVDVNWGGHLYEGHIGFATDNNRINNTIRVILSPPPDFAVKVVTVPQTVVAGAAIRVNYIVDQLGPGEPWEPYWYDTVVSTHSLPNS